MVHALEQACRVLRPGGVLADLRPDGLRGRHELQAGLPLIYAATQREATLVGCVGKTQVRLRSYILADAAVEQVIERGLFRLKAVDRFPFADFFGTLDALDGYAAAHWRTSFIDDSTRARIRAALHENPSRKIVVVEPMQLNVMAAIPSSTDKGV